jgi:hypothetical protein
MKIINAVTYNITGPGIEPNKYGSPTTGLETIISQVIGVLTIVAFIYFAIQIILAGYAFITSNGDAKNIETSRKRLTEGVLGLTIVILALALSALFAKIAGINNVFDLNSLFSNMGL